MNKLCKHQHTQILAHSDRRHALGVRLERGRILNRLMMIIQFQVSYFYIYSKESVYNSLERGSNQQTAGYRPVLSTLL
jgi:hypothetical protein